jgi:hypothetical protein
MKLSLSIGRDVQVTINRICRYEPGMQAGALFADLCFEVRARINRD